MKRIWLAVLAVLLMAPFTFAQFNHVEVGAFGDYVRLGNANNTNFWGLGGRAAFNVHKHVQLEAEMAYDFSQSFVFVSAFNSVVSTNLNVQRANLRLLYGFAGPKFQIGGPIKLYATLKGGAINFGSSNAPVTFGTVNSQVQNFLNSGTNGVFYPAVGIEFFAGPIGLRGEIGDLMYFNNGSNNNLRITFGPQLRF
jgi:hypothetical protein